MTRENKYNVTMMTFALCMSAERLLWCREHETTDTNSAQIEFLTVCKEMQKAGMTNEMRELFGIDSIKESKHITTACLRVVGDSYLK